MIDHTFIENQFHQYISAYDLEDAKILLKAEHTRRVASLSERIAESLKMKDEDIDLAWLLGMLHDIGRFEQVKRYGTFVDAVSVNHAAFGADLLFHEGLIKQFYFTEDHYLLLEKAIRLHNEYQLPEQLTEREKTFCQILRDADKIDIIRVNCEFSRSEIYNLPEEEFATSEISDQVLQDVLSMQNVLRSHRKTAVDYIVGQISLVFGLVYPESKRIICEQGYLEQVMGFRSRNPDTERKMVFIRKKAEEFLGSADTRNS